MTPKQSHSRPGRRLRLERFEPRQMLSATTAETPGDLAIHAPTWLLNDSLIAASDLASAWIQVSDDSSLSFIDAFDTPIGFSGVVTSSASPHLSIADSIGDADSLSLDRRYQRSSGEQPAAEYRFEKVTETLVGNPTPTATATPTLTQQIEIKPEPESRFEPGPTAQPIPDLKPAQRAAEVLPSQVDPTPKPTSSPAASVAAAPEQVVATPAEDPVYDALTQSIITEVAGDTALAIETPETGLVNDASFLPLEERPEQEEATASPFEPNAEAHQAPIIDRQLERLATEEAPPAGAMQPGAGLVDLTALLLDTAHPQQTAQASPPQQPDTLAREAALAVESWVRPLPAGGMMPVTTSPPTPGVQAQRPSMGLVPMEGPTGPPESEKPLIRSVSATQLPSERAATPARSVGPFHFATVVVTTLLGGSIGWTSQRREPSATPDCYERPRRGRK